MRCLYVSYYSNNCTGEHQGISDWDVPYHFTIPNNTMLPHPERVQIQSFKVMNDSKSCFLFKGETRDSKNLMASKNQQPSQDCYPGEIGVLYGLWDKRRSDYEGSSIGKR